MSAFTIKDFQRLGSVRHVAPEWTAAAVSTDSRTLDKGHVFFALPGKQHDGHDFVAPALDAGAVCVVSEAWFERNGHRFAHRPLVVVEDTLKALQQLACHHRQQFGCSVIAVTGTNGKTTCKEMLSAVFSSTFNTVATRGNFNNEIGVPLTLLQIRADTEIAVVEMGADHPGDIALLCEIALPDSGVITNVGKAHLEFFGTVERVAATKLELFNYLLADGVRYINADDPRISPHQALGSGFYTFGYEKPSDYRGEVLAVDQEGCARIRVTGPEMEHLEFQLQAPGLHQKYNALIAASIGLSMGLPAEAVTHALENYRPLSNRLSVRRSRNRVIVDDTYNANPESMRAAVETLFQIACEGRRFCVLGDMLELGESSAIEHQRLGEWLREKSLSGIYLLGPHMKKTAEALDACAAVRHFDKKEELIKMLKTSIQDGDAVLVKGSRGMHMEDVTEALNTFAE